MAYRYKYLVLSSKFQEFPVEIGKYFFNYYNYLLSNGGIEKVGTSISTLAVVPLRLITPERIAPEVERETFGFENFDN